MKNLDKKKKYVVACSFGPDSMALLDMMIKENYNLVVAHVNYHKRKESDFEEESLKKYCKEKKVQLFVLDTSGLKHIGNFQEWARKVRYQFFKDVLVSEGCDAVAVAHQEDDLIETYLMQKSKRSFVASFGIEETTSIFGVTVVRPLLDYTKKELESYDVKNGVPYSIDWTNLTDLYTRNKFRHEIVERMGPDERKQTREIIVELNKKSAINNCCDLSKNTWDLQAFLRENPHILVLQISNNLQKRNIFKKLTIKAIETYKKAFESEHANVAQKLIENIYLVKSYDKVNLVDFDQFKNYEYKIEKPGCFTSEFIDFEFGKDDKDRNICAFDFPLTIKPVNKSETYEVADYNCEVRRLFIDWKMPSFLRGWWPGIYDKHGRLLYIPRYRETYTDNHSSKLVIKYPQF